MRLITNSLKRLIGDKKNTIYGILLVAVAVATPVLAMSLVLSFSGLALVEIESIYSFLRGYTTNTNNAIFKLCASMNIATLILGSILILAYFWRVVNSREKQYKNYLYMGASCAQIALAVWFENFVVLVLGAVLGIILAWIVGVFVGAIYSVSVILSVNTILVSLLIYLALVVIVSIIKPIWTTTSVR